MSMQNKNHYVAIMAGGIGSRFWPMSRTALPKQFLDVLNTGKTLVQWTYERYAKFIPAENIFIVTSEEYVDIVKKQLPILPVSSAIPTLNSTYETEQSNNADRAVSPDKGTPFSFCLGDFLGPWSTTVAPGRSIK